MVRQASPEIRQPPCTCIGCMRHAPFLHLMCTHGACVSSCTCAVRLVLAARNKSMAKAQLTLPPSVHSFNVARGRGKQRPSRPGGPCQVWRPTVTTLNPKLQTWPHRPRASSDLFLTFCRCQVHFRGDRGPRRFFCFSPLFYTFGGFWASPSLFSAFFQSFFGPPFPQWDFLAKLVKKKKTFILSGKNGPNRTISGGQTSFSSSQVLS